MPRFAAAVFALAFAGLPLACTLDALLRLPLERLLQLTITDADAPDRAARASRSLPGGR